MEIVALIIAIVALVVAVLAYARTGGIQELRSQVSALGSTTESLRAKTTDTLDALRAKTADTLERLEKAVRGPGESPSLPVREESRPAPEMEKPVVERKTADLEDKKKVE
jgi:hypothetical protein